MYNKTRTLYCRRNENKKKELAAKKRKLKKQKEEKERLERERIERERQEQEIHELERREHERYQTNLNFRNVMSELMQPIREAQERQRQEEERERLEQEQRRRELEEIRRIELLKQTYRQCKTCKSYNIEKTKEYWFVECTPCYRPKQQKQQKKKCKCGNDIKYSTHTLCYFCYKNSKMSDVDDDTYAPDYVNEYPYPDEFDL